MSETSTYTRNTVLSAAAFLTSVGTLVCCVLPAILVTIGAGAALAGLVTLLPQLIWLSEQGIHLVRARAAVPCRTYRCSPLPQTSTPEPCSLRHCSGKFRARRHVRLRIAEIERVTPPRGSPYITSSLTALHRRHRPPALRRLPPLGAAEHFILRNVP